MISDAELYNLIGQMKQLFAEQTAVTEELTKQRNEIQALIDNVSDPYGEKIESLLEEIRYQVSLREKTFDCDLAKVSFKKGYIRSSWDTKALTGYAAAHPEIEQFKKETEVEPSIQFKWAE